MKRFLFVILGTLTLILGSIGIIVPILPTTPFLLLTLYFYAKGSKRFELWFKNTKLYERRLRRFIEQKAMTKKEKWTLMLCVDAILIVSILIINHRWVTMLLILLDLIKYVYFALYIKTIDLKTTEKSCIQKTPI